MSTLAEPLAERRTAGDLLPAGMLLVVIVSSLVILAHLGVVLWLAWTSGSPGNPDLTYTAANFVEVFSDARTYSVLLDTFTFAFVSLVVALAFGIPAAWLAERTDFRAKTLLFTLMAIGLVIQFLVTTFGLPGPPFNITSLLGMGWVQGLNLAPLAFIMTAAVFRSMDPTLEEAAQMHGATPLTVLRRITV